MQPLKIFEHYNKVVSYIYTRKVYNAAEELKLLIKLTGRDYLGERLNSHLDTYKNILKYSFASVQDPQREQIYHYLLRSMLEFADEIKEKALSDVQFGNVYHQKTQLLRHKPNDSYEALHLLEKMDYDYQLTDLLNEMNISGNAFTHDREEALISIFNRFWLTDKYNEEELSLLTAFYNSRKLHWHDKALIVSALTLSLLRCFDVNKFTALFQFLKNMEPKVWERALVGLFLAFLKYNERIFLYPALREQIAELSFRPDMEIYIEAIVIQFAKAKETQNVTNRWQKEIIPAMLKMRPKIEEKLELDQIFKDEYGEERNPDWETVFEESPGLLDKIQEFTQMQLEGMDVFMGAFAQLKGFPFFTQMSNWFVPFYSDNVSIKPLASAAPNTVNLLPLLRKLENSHFICNSDKYSLSINLLMASEQQKAMIMKMLDQEITNMEELQKSNAIIDDFESIRSNFTQYFQDLYRFYKLHPWRGEFDNPFELELDLYKTHFVRQLLLQQKSIRNIAELYFDKKFYPEALKVYLGIIENQSDNIELFEKIAFCYEKSGQFQEAYSYYLKADLINSDKPWIISKLAFCSKTLNKWEEALFYYKQLERLRPDDMSVQSNIGQCLVHLERFEEALEYYFKIEVLAPENHRIRRPLAWCSFLLGKFETAKDYLERLLAEQPGNPHDLLNLAHVYWCNGKPNIALSYYLKSVEKSVDLKEFQQTFDNDRKYLSTFGITSVDMDLMLDFVKLGGE